MEREEMKALFLEVLKERDDAAQAAYDAEKIPEVETFKAQYRKVRDLLSNIAYAHDEGEVISANAELLKQYWPEFSASVEAILQKKFD